jgi:hypothetical protein
MPTQIDKDSLTILRVLAESPRDVYIEAQQLAEKTGLDPARIGDAVALLVEFGYAEWIQTFCTAPFHFADAIITPRGRYEHQRVTKMSEAAQVNPAAQDMVRGSNLTTIVLAHPPAPVGSPYGFKDEDWEIVAERRSRAQGSVRGVGASVRISPLRYSHSKGECTSDNEGCSRSIQRT